MGVRVPHFSYLISPNESCTKTNAIYSRHKTPLEKSNYSALSIPIKNPRSTNSDGFLILSKKNIKKPQLSLRTASNIEESAHITQQRGVADKKGVLLYQQIERNKLISNKPELVNRFNFKV